MTSKKVEASSQTRSDSAEEQRKTVESSSAGRLPRIAERALIDILAEYVEQWDIPEEDLKGNDDDLLPQIREARCNVRHETGVVYHEDMSRHRCLWDTSHLESPDRYWTVFRRCEQLGLIGRCINISPRKATEKEVLTLHSEEQLNILKNTFECHNVEQLETLSSKYDSVYFHPSTYDVAMMAAGASIELVDAIMKGTVQNGMAIIRPPGHHAMKNEYCGYCYFNNVALAATRALQEYQLKKILLVDWDVHHGQGTQQLFYKDNRLLYFSIHRYDFGQFWPGNLREADFHYVGEGTGKGYNFNVPLNKNGLQDSDYMAIFHQVLLPLAYEYQPELVLVSAGYDAAVGCPKGEMNVSPACYAHFTSSLMGLANGKVAIVLEGGYCLESLAEGVALTLKILLGDPCPPLQPLPPCSDTTQETILNVIYTHRAFWQCFQFQGKYSINTAVCSRGRRHLPHVKFLGRDEKPKCYDTRSCNSAGGTHHDIPKENLLDFASTSLSVPPHRVSLVYDNRMLKHRDLRVAGHPERPDRIATIYARHKEFGLLDRCLIVQPRFTTEDELLLLHTSKHISEIQGTKNMDQKALYELERENWGAYLHPDSYEAATLAAGCVLQTVDSVLQGVSRSGVAIVRPPGHHAERDEASGFCIFSNVALAAKYAIEIHGLQRILIVDWDIHHGNGTQNSFYGDKRVLYMSLHSYHQGYWFPWLLDGDHKNIGTGDGEGYTVNIPWDEEGMGDAEYLSAFYHIILPIAYQYNPELVLISAGFDSARGDPLGDCRVSPETYGHLTHLLSSLARGRLVVVLEGGYNQACTSYSMALCTKALLGDPLCPLAPNLFTNPSGLQTLNNVICVHQKYWSCLKFQQDLPEEDIVELK